MELAIGIIFTALITWIFCHYYYKRANHDQNRLFDKLPEYIRQGIIEDQRDKITVKELNKLIRLKTIDQHEEGVRKFKACPKCGSKNLTIGRDVIDVDADGDQESGPIFTPIYADIIICRKSGQVLVASCKE
jgi:hypothetical protein